MSAHAECVVASSTGRALILYNSPDGKCVKFQMDTADTWLHYGEHFFFRKDAEKIEVLIVNVLEKHHNFSINCMRTTDENIDPIPSGCEMPNMAIIYISPDERKCNAHTHTHTQLQTYIYLFTVACNVKLYH